MSRGRPAQFDPQAGLRLADPIQQVGLLLRQSERAALIGERVDDRLPDPPHRVRDELDVLVGIEPLGGLDQADVASLIRSRNDSPQPR